MEFDKSTHKKKVKNKIQFSNENHYDDRKYINNIDDDDDDDVERNSTFFVLLGMIA